MAMACFGFVTFFPRRPDLSIPRFIALISVSTSFPTEGEYFRSADFLDAVFFPLFFVAPLDWLLAILFSSTVRWLTPERSCPQQSPPTGAKRLRMGWIPNRRSQYLTMAVNESGFRLAPPTSAPSICSLPRRAVALSGFTLPP